MVRNHWKQSVRIVFVFAFGIVVGLVAQSLERPAELSARFLKDAMDSTRQFSIDTRTAAVKEKIEMELARLEWEIAATNAFHEFARSVWVANEKFRRSARDPQSRGQYAQAFGTAYSHYMQAISTAYSSWMQARSQAFQRFQQEMNIALSTLQSALTQNLQRAQQGIQQLTKAPDPVALSKLVEVTLLVPGEPDVEFRKAIDEATNKFAKEIKEITASHSKEVAKFARPEVDIDEADSALRKANRKWFESAIDALDNYRRACHTALRRYKTKLEGE